MSATDIPPGVHKLKLGKSFSKDSGERYHTVRYDFQPASVEDCNECFVEFGPKAETTVSMPKLDSSGDVKDVTLFKGSRKPYSKECLLIYDHDTGEFTLEDLTCNVQVKQVRSGEEEREKNVAYVREIRQRFRKCTDLFSKSDQTPSALQQDVLMSDEEEEEEEESSSSSSSSSESDDEKIRSKNSKTAEERVKNCSRPKNSSDNEESGDEDDIAKSLEAVVASTSSVNLSPSTQNANLSAHSASVLPASATDTLHDDLHLSDSSEEEDA